MAKSYKVTVISGTKVVADMAKNVMDATIEASIQVKTIEGGVSSSVPTILAPGPTGANRKMEDVEGWFVNGTDAEPPVAVGTPWEAPTGFKNSNWWDGITWSLGSSVPLPMQQGVDVIDPVGEELPKEKAVANYVIDRTIPLKLSKNLFNPAWIVQKAYVGTDTAIINYSAPDGWSFSGLIDLDAIGIAVGQQFTLSSDKTRVGHGFYKADKSPSRYIGGSHGTFVRQADERYFAFNITDPTQLEWTWIQLEKGPIATTPVPFIKVAAKENIEGLVDALTKVDEVSVVSGENQQKLKSITVDTFETTNKLDPSKTTFKALLGWANGSLVTGTPTTDQYNVTDFIPVESGEFIEILNSVGGSDGARNFAVFGATKNYLGGQDLSARPRKVQMPVDPLIRYARFTLPGLLFAAKPNTYTPENMGIFHGENNVYEPFDGGIIYDIENDSNTLFKNNNSIATINDVKNLLNTNPSETTALTYLTYNGALKISSGADYITVGVGNQRVYGGNNMLNFAAISFAGLNYTNGDDAAPIHAHNTTIGANHGPACYIATISNHGLTNVDIGTAFTQNAAVLYLARIVSNMQVIFIGEKRGTDDNPSFDALIAGTIVRNGTNYTVTTATAQQLYPSIQNLKLQVFVDGKEIDHQANLNGQGNIIEVVESYEIKTLQSIIEGLKARVGSPDEPTFSGEGFIRIENNYRFVEDLTCIVNVRTRQLKRMIFADIMGTQANLLGTTNNGTVEMYVPNSRALNGSVDLRKPKAITWSNSIPSTSINIATSPDPLNPPNRIIEYKNNTGFSLGYLKNKGVGKNLPAFTSLTFEIRNNTGKLYPHPVEAEKVGNYQDPNAIYNISMFRAFTNLTLTRDGNRLSYFTVKDGDDMFIYLDYIGSKFDEINLNKAYLNGRQIEIVESKNCVLLSDFYNNGFIVNATYVEGETCFMVVNISR